MQPKKGKQAHWFGRPSWSGVHLAQVVLLPDTPRSAALGSHGLGHASRKKCVLLCKLKQRDLPWGSREMSMLSVSSCLSQEGERVGNQRLSHVMLDSIESLQQRILPKCKRCFCPKSWCVQSERGQIKVLRWWLIRLQEPDGCVRSYMTFWNSWRDLMMLSS